MDFWRRACGVSRLEHVRNDEIRRRVHRNKDIMDTINMKRLIWYGHVQECPKNGGPKGCWIGYQTGEEKGEDPDETGERIYT